jgi:hypothetical protein
MAASFVANLAAAAATSTTNSTTIVITSNVTVAAGDTVFLVATARGVTTGVATLSGLPGDAVTETLKQNLASNLSSCHLFRIYCPTGMASGTAITVTWDAANTKKIAYGAVWTQVANSNNQGTAGATAVSAGPPTAGTTGATTTTTGVHVGAYGANFTTSPVTAVAGSDEEGVMTERTDTSVGASAFGWCYYQDRPVAVAHAGGMTAPVGTVTGTIVSWYGVQGVWDGAAAATKAFPFLRRDASVRNPLLRR